MLKQLQFGFSATWNRKGMVALYYGVNLLFAVVCLLPFYLLVSSKANQTLVEQLPGGLASFTFFMELASQQNTGIGLPITLGLIIALFFLAFTLFLSAGVFTAFNLGGPSTASVFWGGVGYFFFRFLRLFLWSLPLMLFIPLGVALVDLFVGLVYGSDPYQSVIYWSFWSKIAVLFIFFFYYRRVMDYARIQFVISDGRKARVALVSGLRFVIRHFFPVTLLALVLLVLTILVSVVQQQVSQSLSSAVGNWVLVLLVGQVFVFVKVMLKLSLLGAEFGLYKDRTQEPEDDEDQQAGDDQPTDDDQPEPKPSEEPSFYTDETQSLDLDSPPVRRFSNQDSDLD